MEKTNNDRLFTWLCVLVYFAAWLAMTSSGLRPRLLLPAAALSAIYAGLHYYEMTVRGHCALSADATAIPGAFAAVLAGALLAWLGGIGTPEIIDFLLSVPAAWIAGHVAAFGVIWLGDRFGWLK